MCIFFGQSRRDAPCVRQTYMGFQQDMQDTIESHVQNYHVSFRCTYTSRVTTFQVTARVFEDL